MSSLANRMRLQYSDDACLNAELATAEAALADVEPRLGRAAAEPAAAARGAGNKPSANAEVLLSILDQA